MHQLAPKTHQKILNNIHIEKFMIDILQYIDNSTVCEGTHYLVYDIKDEENIADITSILDCV